MARATRAGATRGIEATPVDVRLGELPSQESDRLLVGEGLGLRIGPFDMQVRSDVPGIHEGLRLLYRDHRVLGGERVYSCHAELRKSWQWLPRPERRIRFSVDGMVPHEDLPAGQGLAVLEWGINLAIAMRFHCFFMLHAAVVERNGYALLLPASPGHGKTTLCAALVHRGWRLFSDEFGLVRPGDRRLIPVPRPMPLKNESIEVIRAFVPEAELGPSIPGTKKGTVAHVKPPAASVERADETAAAGWIVFPRWRAGADLEFSEAPKAEAFMQLATNAFNYEIVGEPAFEATRGLVDGARSFHLVYSDLEEAIAALTEMSDRDAR